MDTYTHTAEIQDKQFTSGMYPVKAQTQNNSSRVEYKAQSDPFQKVTEVLLAHLSYNKYTEKKSCSARIIKLAGFLDDLTH